MIVRDEEAHLPACLESIRPIVDEIVIVDTGSTDRTIEIARDWGARVEVHQWDGDFSEARNIGLELARGTWILHVDADERLRPVPPSRVRTRLREASEIALRVRRRPFVGATPCWETRIWRSDPRIRFQRRIHERVAPAIDTVAAADHLLIGEIDLFLEHIGYDGDQTRKHERNLPLLRGQLTADPDNVFDWRALSRALAGLGKSEEAEEALERAVEYARSSDAGAGGLVFADLVSLRREQGANADALLEEGLRLYPNSIALAWEKVRVEMEAGRYEAALHWLERFDADLDMPVEDKIAYPTELFGVQAPQARGLCLFRLGRYREAAAAYSQAEAFEPHELSHRLKRIVAEQRARRHEDDAASAHPNGVADGSCWSARDLLLGLTVDIGGVSVELSATDAVRAAAIHRLLGRMPTSRRRPEIGVRFGRHLLPLPEREAEETQGPLRLWYDDGAFSIAWGPWVSGRAEAGRGQIGGHLRDLAEAFRGLGPFVLGSLLAPKDRFVMRAGAIERHGRAMLVVGESDAARSTLILAAIDGGWNVLADELIVVRSDSPGPSVSGIPTALVVPADVAGERTGVEVPSSDGQAGVRIPFETWTRGWHPVAGVLLAEQGAGARASAQPASDRSRLVLLLAGAGTQQPAKLELADALSELPGWQLLHGRAPETRVRDAAQAIAKLVE